MCVLNLNVSWCDSYTNALIMSIYLHVNSNLYISTLYEWEHLIQFSISYCFLIVRDFLFPSNAEKHQQATHESSHRPVTRNCWWQGVKFKFSQVKPMQAYYVLNCCSKWFHSTIKIAAQIWMGQNWVWYMICTADLVPKAFRKWNLHLKRIWNNSKYFSLYLCPH